MAPSPRRRRAAPAPSEANSPGLVPAQIHGPARTARAELILPDSRTHWIVAITCTILSLLFHIARVHWAGAPWRDEITTASVADQPTLAAFYNHLRLDSFPAMTALLLRVWRAAPWGAGDTGLRVFGMLVGFGIVAVLWRNSWRLGRCPPVCSMALLAASPVIVQWGDTVRGYGLGTLLSMLLVGLVAQLIAADRLRLRSFLPAAAVAFLCVQSLYQNSFLVAAICIGAGMVAVHRRRWRLLIGLGCIGVLSASGLFIYLPVLRSLSQVHELVQFPTDIGELLAKLIKTLMSGGLFSPLGWIAMLLLLCSAPWLTSRSASSDLAVFALVTSLVAVIGFFIYLQLLHFGAKSWYFIPLLGTLIACADIARIGLLPPHPTPSSDTGRAGEVLSWALAGIVLFSLPTVWSQLHERQTNIDYVARMLQTRMDGDDVVLIIPEYLAPAFRRYFRGSNAVLTVPPTNDPSLEGLFNIRHAMLEEHPIDGVLQTLTQALQGGHRVWAFLSVPAPPEGESPAVLPPPPLPESGWDQEPYLRSWERQAGYLLKQHADHIDQVVVDDPPGVNQYEHVTRVLRFSGWKP